MQLRDYQIDLDRQIDEEWAAGNTNVAAVLPTGAGKTISFSNKIARHRGPSVAIAHRQELVSQISMSLAKFGVKHNILASQAVIRFIVQHQMKHLGNTFFDPGADCMVAGVQTLVRRKDDLASWSKKVGLWVIDESHHILRDNQWGKAVSMFPNAKGLGVTATLGRADGNGLGIHNDGVFHSFVEGPTMRELINRGNLTEYRIFNPPNDMNLEEVSISNVTGDYSKKQLTVAARKSHIVGDVVAHYKRLADGKLGVTFVTDVATASEVAQQYNEAGVPAAVVSAKTPDHQRAALIERFARREILQLVNVDLFGEGFDLPAIEVVSMARPTQSLNLFIQQFGRACRPLEGKSHAIIIDHVGNVTRHGLPDAPRMWSLERRPRRVKNEHDPDMIPVKTCVSCTAVYEAIYKVCPFCGHMLVPIDRSKPEYVDGDLVELDQATLAMMRGEIEKIDMPPEVIKARMNHMGPMIAGGAAKQHRLRSESQELLRAMIAWWAGCHRSRGCGDSEIYRRFYFKFGVDIMTAQTLGRPDAITLTNKINKSLAA